MWKFAPLVLKNLWRHRTRTILTVSGSAVGLLVYCFVAAVQSGLGRLTDDAAAERTLIVFQQNRFCPSTSKLPERYTDEIAKIDGVEEVIPIKVFMNNCRASLDLVVFHGIPPQKLRLARDLRLVAGSWDEFTSHRDSALVGRALAARRGIEVGKPFSIGDVRVQVAGIFAADHAGEENFLYTHLEFLQQTRVVKSPRFVTQFEVMLKDGADSQKVCRAIDAHLGKKEVATDTRTKGAFQANAVSDLADLIRFAGYLGYACVGLVLALIATTTVMAVQDRVREHAVLQTLGFTEAKIFGMVLAESLLVSLAGGVLGIGLAVTVLTMNPIIVGAEGVSIPFLPSFGLAVTGLIIAAIVGVLAGLVPAWQAARAEIVASLRAV